MAKNIEGPLYYERMGRTGPVMAFIHPNPLDQSCWLYQMAHFSTWFRCVAIDIPGYGRSPKAKPGLTLADIAAACWEAIDVAAAPGEGAVLVGCSVGSQVLPYMSRQSPARSLAMIMTGVGYNPAKEFAARSIDAYSAEGIGYREEHAFLGMSAAFRPTQIARYLGDIFLERNAGIDVPSLLHQFRAHQLADPDDLHSAITCPAVILTGTEDGAHAGSFVLRDRIPGCELKILPGGGHTAQFEQPWLFDRLMIEFLKKHGLLKHAAASAQA
jgi:pimeloyl-ACP methyl ester carboxylesterase